MTRPKDGEHCPAHRPPQERYWYALLRHIVGADVLMSCATHSPRRTGGQPSPPVSAHHVRPRETYDMHQAIQIVPMAEKKLLECSRI